MNRHCKRKKLSNNLLPILYPSNKRIKDNKVQFQYGLYRFKKGFGAKFTEFIGEIYIPFKPMKYKLYKFSEKAFRTIRQIKRKLLK